MPQFEVRYFVRIERMFRWEIAGQDADAALEEALHVLSHVEPTAFPGTLEDQSVEFTVDEIDEV
jgi:hypothetical protein